MRDTLAHPGSAIRHEEGEFYLLASATIDGESHSIRVPLGDGRYLAEQVMEKIVGPAISPRVLDRFRADDTTSIETGSDSRHTP
tara:strand:+ start:3974 stop:4225 length:252 start_codon:yes stop_codon:yes gene_type:complete